MGAYKVKGINLSTVGTNLTYFHEHLENRNGRMEKSSAKAATATYSSQKRKRQMTPQLNCELCREKKIKCDKLEPCTNCLTSGVTCVSIRRLRLPRGVHAARPRHRLTLPTTSPEGQTSIVVDESLNKCISKLQALVDSLSSVTARADTASRYPQEQVSRAMNVTFRPWLLLPCR